MKNKKGNTRDKEKSVQMIEKETHRKSAVRSTTNYIMKDDAVISLFHLKTLF